MDGKTLEPPGVAQGLGVGPRLKIEEGVGIPVAGEEARAGLGDVLVAAARVGQEEADALVRGMAEDGPSISL
jgi:hypothetical protein